MTDFRGCYTLNRFVFIAPGPSWPVEITVRGEAGRTVLGDSPIHPKEKPPVVRGLDQSNRLATLNLFDNELLGLDPPPVVVPHAMVEP